MPTKHQRIAVQCDRELRQALATTRPMLRPEETRSDAAHVRALALRGASAVAADESSEAAAARARLADRISVPATLRLAAALPALEAVDPSDPTPASDALDWVRGKDRDH